MNSFLLTDDQFDVLTRVKQEGYAYSDWYNVDSVSVLANKGLLKIAEMGGSSDWYEGTCFEVLTITDKGIEFLENI